MSSELELTDKARKFLRAAAKGNGSEIEFYFTVTGAPAGNIYSVIVGREFSARQIEHRTYLEYLEAAQKLVTDGLATEKFEFSGDREHVYELTLEGYKTANLISRVGE